MKLCAAIYPYLGYLVPRTSYRVPPANGAG